MAPPRIPGHESEDIVDMTPAYAPEEEADGVVDMTPAYAPNGEADDVVDMTPYAPDGEADDIMDMTPPAPNGGSAERPAKTRAYAPDGESEPGWDGTPAYGGESGAYSPMAAPSAPTVPQRKPQGAPWERAGGLANVGKGPWKLIGMAVAGLIVVALVVKVVGGLGPLGGGQASQATAVPTTSTPVQIGGQPITTAVGPLILLNPGVVRQGTQVAVTGSGFDPGAPVDLMIKRQGSATALTTTQALADKNGMVVVNLTVPTTLSSGAFVVEAQERNSKKTAQAAGTVAGGAPQVKLGKQVGQPGTVITITLHGFAPEETVNVYWNTMSGQPVTTFKADGGGSVGQANLQVPFGAVGDNTFLFVGANSQSMVAASFLVLSLYPSIKLSSYALKADNAISYSGSGFGPGERVLIFINSTNTPPVAVVQTDAAGAFKNAPGFVIPFALTGKQTLIFMGEQSRAPNAVNFTVLPYSPIVEPSTYGGFPGTTITFFATGFARNEVVHIYAGHTKSAMGNMVSCFQTDGKGNAGAGGSYLIPGDAQGALGFALVGVKSGGVGVASVNVTAPPFPVHTPPQPAFTCPLDPPAPQQPPAAHAPNAPQADAIAPSGQGAARHAVYALAYVSPSSTVSDDSRSLVVAQRSSTVGLSNRAAADGRSAPDQVRAATLALGLGMVGMVWLLMAAAVTLIPQNTRRKARYSATRTRLPAVIGVLTGWSWAALAGARTPMQVGEIEGDLMSSPGGSGLRGAVQARARLPTAAAPRRRSRFVEKRPRASRDAALDRLRRVAPWAWRLAGGALELGLLAAALALTRVLSLDLWRLPVGDVGLYYHYAQLFWTSHPLLRALPVEYPPLAILPFSLTLLPASRDYTTPYAYWMGALVVVGYLGFLRYSTRPRAVVYALYLLIGATATLLARFDIVPALVTLAALWATQRRHFSYAYLLIAAGALIKLYPIFLLPVVLIADARAATPETPVAGPDAHTLDAGMDVTRRHWWQGGPGTAVKRVWAQPAARRVARGGALCLGLVALGFGVAFALNPASALSSFFYVGVRPLQVESIPASLLWLGTLVGIPAGPVFSFSSLNYVGPLDALLKPLSAVALLAVCGVVYVRQARGRLSVGQAFLACLCALIATNKIFSPQYLIWALPIVAAVEGFDLLWLAICVLTTIDYPILYLTQPTFATVTYTPAFLPLLAARNLLLVVVTVRAVRRSPALACAASEALGAGDHAQMPQIVEETSGMSGRGRPRPYDRIPQRLTAVWDHALASVRSRLGSFIPRRASLIPASKFLVVGGLGALVNTGVLALLYHYGHFALVAASAVATEMAIAHNFLWNNYWTFGRRSVSLSRFARFNLVSLAGQGITVATLWILVQHTTLHYIVANLAGIGLALAWNFTVSVRWTWARRN